MRKGHLVGCGIAIVLVLGFLAFTGGSSAGLGLLVVALACPVAMVVAMKFLMGGQHTEQHGRDVRTDTPTANASRDEGGERGR